jgi:hypothetical protein
VQEKEGTRKKEKHAWFSHKRNVALIKVMKKVQKFVFAR